MILVYVQGHGWHLTFLSWGNTEHRSTSMARKPLPSVPWHATCPDSIVGSLRTVFAVSYTLSLASCSCCEVIDRWGISSLFFACLLHFPTFRPRLPIFLSPNPCGDRPTDLSSRRGKSVRRAFSVVIGIIGADEVELEELSDRCWRGGTSSEVGKREMGRLFLVSLEGKIYSCKHCQAHLALVDDIVSRVR